MWHKRNSYTIYDNGNQYSFYGEKYEVPQKAKDNPTSDHVIPSIGNKISIQKRARHSVATAALFIIAQIFHQHG